VQVSDPTVVFDLQQRKDITLEDDELMREGLSAWIDDTSQQLS